MRCKWVYAPKKITCWVYDDVAYHTNDVGDGIFKIYYDGIIWHSKQICATYDFTIRCCNTLDGRRRKFRKWLVDNGFIY